MFTITSIRTSILDGLRGWRRHPKLFVGSASGIIAAVMVFVFLAVTRAAPGDITLSPPTGPASGGTSVTMTASPGWTGQTVDFPFGGSGGTTGLMQSFTAPVAGLYKLEVWGAQGGNAPSGGQGGRGGYSTVTVQLNANQVIYIASGGQGGAASGTTGTGGWNGGGNTNSNAGGGGGGASHISLNTATTATPLSDNNVRTNLLVAAGGGGGTQTAGVAGCHGGWGGGTTGGSSQTNVGGGGACTGNGASGGTQTAGGTTLASQGASGTAGIGATSTQQGGSIYGGGGGGGWFGGGASNGTGGGGGGGSGWLRTAALNGVAITNAQTLAGNASFLEPNGTATVGHVGNGYARVTILAPGLYVKPVVQFGTQGGTTTTIPDVNVTWCNYDGSICTNGGAPNTVTFTTPARGSMPQTVDAWLAFDPSKTGEFTYWTPATNYAQQCSTDGGTTWDYRRNIYSGTGSGPPVTGALCRLKLDNAFSGTIVLNDGYSAINPGLSGTFGQGSGPYNDTRFDPSTRTFTVDYTDTYNTAGQYLYYTYNSPDWSTLISYWTVSNQAALMQPSISVTPVPNSGVPNIVQAGDAQAFWIYANSYEILHADNTITLSAGSEVPFQVTTYGALYTGTITITEDLSQSDDPSGTAGSFRQNPMTFSGNGQPQTFFYTPETTTIAQTTNHITLDGASSPAITDDDIDVQVVPAAMRLDGPTNLSRGEYGEYTLTIYDTSISSVALADLINGMSSAGGTFVDTTAAPYDATFTSGTSTYDTTSCTTITIPADPGCERTFRYTVDPGLSHNASYIVINATGDVTDTFASINVTINADALEFACGPSSPNCTIAYVNETSEYTVSPDGIFTGSTTITSPDSGATINFVPGGTASTSWADDAGTKVFNYTPSTPGRYVLSAVTTSTNSAMNQTFYSNGPGGLTANGGYIWVIANQTTFFTGDDTIPNGGSGTYTLALNGPFIGTVILSDNDTVNGIPQGGTFDNGGTCTFTLANYDPVSNTSTCTFVYTPTVAAEERTITLAPSFPPEFARPMAITPIDITVYGYPDIRFIDPTEGPSTGGNTVWLTGFALQGVSYITFGGVIDDTTDPANPVVVGGVPCTNLRIITEGVLEPIVTCTAPAHPAGQVNVFANNIIPPPDIDNTDPGNPVEIPREPVQYTYFDVATDFVNECSEDGGITWTTTPYVPPGTTVPCQVVLNGRWNGPVELSDDWHTTISPGLSGTFASADGRFDSGTNTFNVQYGDTVDPVGPTVSTGQTLSYTWTSPSWNTLMGYWNPDRSNESDLWWPMINVDIPIDVFENTFLTSTDDNVVFGLLAQSYFIAPDGTYDYYCIECEVDFIVSTYGAPYEGTISITDDLSNSDNPSGTHGEFWAGGVASNPGVIHFAGSDGTDSSFSYIPQTTATPTNAGPPAVPWDVFIRLQGTSSDPAVNNAYYDIAPVKDPGIFIIPSSGCSFIARGQTCSYTLSVTIGTGWSGTIVLNDEFMNGTAGGGVFADASGGGDGNPSGTFSGGNTYTFTAGGGETYERTFTYTLRDDGVVPPTFPSHILQLTATEPVTNAQTFTNLFIDASRVNIGCASSSPNCTIGYVGVLQDYTYTPNGAFMATVSVSASDAGSLGTLTWPTIAATTGTLSYTPQTPGRQVLTATVNTSSIPSMVGQSFTSTGPVPGTSPPVYDPLNLNDYIWVMANQMTITGPSYLRYGATGTFTLTMNGPFIGTVDLNDFLNADGGAAAGGAFSTPSCTFNISDYDSTTNPTGYDSVTNTSSCTFTYTPYAFEDLTNVVLGPSISGYTGPMTRTPLPVTVYGRPIIDTVSPDTGPTTGGTGFGVSHDPNGVIVLTGAGLVTGGSTLNFDSIFMGNIEVDLSSITINPDGSIEFVPPPNAAGEVDITVNAGGRVYHHPGYYTYIPEIDSITPIIGPTTGGTGFGVSYNANGTATITGVGITNAAQYADTTTGQPFSGQQFYQLGWLDFNGSQYINTGVNQLGNTSMTIDATRDSGQYAAGVLVAGHYYTITLPTDGFMFPTAFYGNSNAAAGGAMHLGDRILATLDADGTTADFTVRLNNGATNTNTITPGTPPSTPYNIYLGSANNGAGAAAGMVGRIYSFSINKDLAADDRNMVPVCTMDGTTGGMFDTLHNVFYPSASGTPFACDNSSIPPPTVNFGGTVATNVTAVDLNTIVVVPPAHAEGTVDVNVIVNGITVTLTQAYTYRAPMTVETVFPPTGSQEGGTELIITGHNFIWVDDTTPPALSYTITLDIGGTPAPCIIADVSTDVTNDTIVCTTSAHEAGLVTVTVNNSVETFTMEVVPGPSGNGMPTLDGYGRSTGGFLYSSDFYLEISASDDTLTLNISPSSPFDEGYFDVSVATNNATGYTLFIESEGANLVCVDTGSSSLVIPSTVGNAIDNGTWGFQVGTSPTTNGWAPTPTTPTAIASSSGPTFVTPPAVAEDTQINFAVRDGKPTPISPNCSMYVQNVIHTAVANT